MLRCAGALRARAAKDEIAVVRLHDLADEPFGDRQTAEFRIAAYQDGSVPYTEVTPQESLERVATLIRQIGSGYPGASADRFASLTGYNAGR